MRCGRNVELLGALLARWIVEIGGKGERVHDLARQRRGRKFEKGQ